MSKLEIIFTFFFLIFLPSLINSQIDPETLPINTTVTVTVTSQGKLYNLVVKPDDIKDNNYISISTKPADYRKPAFIYVSYDTDEPASKDNRTISSQEIGTNILYISANELNITKEKTLSVFISSLFETEVELRADLGPNVVLQNYPLGFRHRFNLKMTSQSDESTNVFFEMTQPFEETKKVLFYALGEKIEYFDFSVKLVGDSGEKKSFEVKQTFENGYGAIVDVTKDLFEGGDNPRIRIIAKASSDEYINRKVELGFEIIDSVDNKKDIRDIEILEHVYGLALKETCYKVKDIQNSTAIMLLNTFTQSVMFNIRNEKDIIVYSLDVFNNYFIKLPQEFYDPDYYFCFKHITPKTEEEEKYGEVSYDFQIYYENELSDYQLFIMPLINGKIYTHILKSGDIMAYRNSFYDGLSEKKIYSANMLRISGNPHLYGITCTEYPNCVLDPKNLKDSSDKVFPLNMYYINKRLNAEGNTEVDPKGEAVYELRKQYMTVVSCESDETYPNNGECKYTIEINNEGNTIQLKPETVFSTSIISPENYFMISLKDYQTLKNLKLHFTVLTGNAELSIYTDSKHETKLTDYNFNLLFSYNLSRSFIYSIKIRN